MSIGNEIKGLLWWSLGQTTMIMTILFLFLGVKIWILWYLVGIAIFDTIVGVLEYFGVIDKIRGRKK